MERLNQIREENEAKLAKAQSSDKPKGSIASKANLVKEYNEKNNNN